MVTEMASSEEVTTNGGVKPAYRPVSVLWKMKTTGVDYAKVLWDYKVLFFVGAVLFGSSAVVRLVPLESNPAVPCNGELLCTHGTTLWGIVTSVFVYDSWTNIPSFFAILIVYAQFSDRLDSIERKRRAKFSAVAIFVAAFAANALWVHFLPSTYSWGPSGVVYALWGVMFAFTLFDGMPKSPTGLDPRNWYKDKKERKAAFGSLAMSTATAAMLFTEPAVFLSAGPGIIVFVHGVSFLGGYFGAHVYRWTAGKGTTSRPLHPPGPRSAEDGPLD